MRRRSQSFRQVRRPACRGPRHVTCDMGTLLNRDAPLIGPCKSPSSGGSEEDSVVKRQVASGIVLAGAALAALRWRLRRRRYYDFRGRVVVITGGSRGLGLVLARHLAGEQARLVLLARNPEELERARDELGSRTQVLARPCDVRDREQVVSAFDAAVQRFGGIDVLINNAGVIQVGPVEHMTRQDFEESLAVHLWGPLETIQAAVPHMRLGGGGRIINISSIGGRLPVPHLVPYITGKFALAGLSEALRVELARTNIYVTTVYPGLMRTGSPPNAQFKGQFREEYAWFSILDALPVVAMDADRAAGRILQACRRGKARLVLPLKTKLAFAAEALFPELTADALSLVNRLLPRPAGHEGDHARTGWESRSMWSPSVLTHLGDRATATNNERPPDLVP